MNEPLTLLMAIHCHQPVGNFGFVFEEACDKAYDPFLRILERHPGVRLSLHYSGCLLDWLQANRPEFLDRVRTLASRGQVELLASGYYEPILPLIPEADRQGQIAQMRQALRTRFGTDAAGLWLTERVWEPDLPATLARAGIRHTMVDVNQFAHARPWLPEDLQVADEQFWDLLGCYATEYAGESVLLFPASKRLRYWMPFQRVERTIDFLKSLRREAPTAITFADDGEKFGLWPKTHHWVYEEGWLDQFFGALEREQPSVRTATFAEYAQQAGPSGRVWLPCGSYEEMLEWSGGHFRNFFAKYPEANAMQQKMLRISRSIRERTNSSPQASGSRPQAKNTKLAAGSLQPAAKKRIELLRQAENELYAGQCNCAYWHGVFGGLYLSHLRRAVYAHLIAAERLVDEASGWPSAVTALDADGDGRDELVVKTPAMGLVIDPDEGGAVTEWSVSGPRINLFDTLTRRPESYHAKLKADAFQPVGAAGGEPRPASGDSRGKPASIHDLVQVKEEHLASRVIYDDHRRSAFLDYGLDAMPTLEEVARASWTERPRWSPAPYRWEPSRPARLRRGFGGQVRGRAGPPAVTMVRDVEGGGRIRKIVRAARQGSRLECLYMLDGVEAPVVALEFTLGLRDARYLAQAGRHERLARFTIEEPSAGVSVRLSMDPPATLFHVPIDTISESEEGLERTYQGLGLVCCWPTEPARGGAWTGRLQWDVVSLRAGPCTPPTEAGAGLKRRS